MVVVVGTPPLRKKNYVPLPRGVPFGGLLIATTTTSARGSRTVPRPSEAQGCCLRGETDSAPQIMGHWSRTTRAAEIQPDREWLPLVTTEGHWSRVIS